MADILPFPSRREAQKGREGPSKPSWCDSEMWEEFLEGTRKLQEMLRDSGGDAV